MSDSTGCLVVKGLLESQFIVNVVIVHICVTIAKGSRIQVPVVFSCFKSISPCHTEHSMFTTPPPFPPPKKKILLTCCIPFVSSVEDTEDSDQLASSDEAS